LRLRTSRPLALVQRRLEAVALVRARLDLPDRATPLLAVDLELRVELVEAELLVRLVRI